MASGLTDGGVSRTSKGCTSAGRGTEGRTRIGSAIPMSYGAFISKLGKCESELSSEHKATEPPWLASVDPETPMNRALNVFLFNAHAEQKMMNPLASPSAAKRNRLELADCFLSVLSSHCMVRFFKADTHLSI